MKRLICSCVSAALFLAWPSVSWSAEDFHQINSTINHSAIEVSEQPILEFPNAAPLGMVKLADAKDALPQTFDPRESGTPMNPIQHRTKTEDIWAYQATSALELSTYKTTGQMQKFSEHHMLAAMTFDRKNPFTSSLTEGGNRIFSTAYLSRGSGPVLQTDFNEKDYQSFLSSNQNTDPTSPQNNTYNASLLDISRENKNFIPVEYLTASSEGTYSNRFANEDSEGLNTNYEKIKRAVYQYGAVTTDYYMYETDDNGNTTDFYNSDTNAYFFRSKNYSSDDQPYDEQGEPIPANGTVTIVGWDDNFPINNFNDNNLPPQNGAWIVRTDRGSSWGENGYEYISYYDHMFGRNASVFKPEDGTYHNVYQYDPLLNIDSSKINPAQIKTNNLTFNKTNVLWISNRFEKSNSLPETIEAVGFYVQSYNYIAELYIDTAPTSSTPSTAYGSTLLPQPLKNGDLGLSTQITFASPGYYILELKEPISINGSFDITLRLENVQHGTSTANSLVFGFASGNSLSSNITKSEHSFYSQNPTTGFTAVDKVTAALGPCNWNIKAYTNIEKPSFTATKTEAGIQFILRDTEPAIYTGSKVIAAFYDKDNTLIDTKVFDVPAFILDNGFSSWTHLLGNNEIPNNAMKCRSFIWQDLNTMIPTTSMIAEITL